MKNKQGTIEVIKIGLVMAADIGIGMLVGAAAGMLILASGNSKSVWKTGLMAFGGIVAGGMLAEASAGYVEEQVDFVVDVVDRISTMRKAAKEVSE